MQQRSSRDDQTSLMQRLDRVADGMNPFLIILTAIRVTTMGLSSFPITRVDPSCLIAPTSTLIGIESVKRPS